MLVMDNALKGASAPVLPNSEAALALAPSTVIPTLGLTFAQAEGRITAGMGLSDLTGGDADALADELADLAQAIHEAAPVTLSDALAKLRVLTGPMGYGGGDSPDFLEAARQVVEFLERLQGEMRPEAEQKP